MLQGWNCYCSTVTMLDRPASFDSIPPLIALTTIGTFLCQALRPDSCMDIVQSNLPFPGLAQPSTGRNSCSTHTLAPSSFPTAIVGNRQECQAITQPLQ